MPQTRAAPQTDGSCRTARRRWWVRRSRRRRTRRWIRDGNDTGEATDPTYRLVDTDEGERITVRVTFRDDAGNDESLISEATEGVAPVLLDNELHGDAGRARR